MITDIPISNIFVPRNDWHLKRMECKKYTAHKVDDYYKLQCIMNEVISKSKIPKEVFMSKTRYRPVVEARQCYFKRAREKTSASLDLIGSFVESGDHANVLYGINQVNTVPTLKKKYDEYFNQ